MIIKSIFLSVFLNMRPCQTSLVHNIMLRFVDRVNICIAPGQGPGSGCI
jgi:hypothetical protein